MVALGPKVATGAPRDVRLKDGENVYLEETDEESDGRDGGLPLLREEPEAAGLGTACPQNAPGPAVPAFRVDSRPVERERDGRVTRVFRKGASVSDCVA